MYGLCREAAVEDPLEMVALGLISYKGMHPERAPRYVEDQEPEIVELADAMGIHREAVVVPLGRKDPGSVRPLGQQVQITLPDSVSAEEWSETLRAELEKLGYEMEE